MLNNSGQYLVTLVCLFGCHPSVSVPILRMFLLSGQCSVPLSPLLRPGSDGSASFTSPAGDDLDCLFAYHLSNKGVMLAVWFNVPSECSNGSNDFAVAIYD